jgi:haloalkane dehalogenase
MSNFQHPKFGEVLRTPDSAFENLSDYPFQPNYMDVDGSRMHYIDEGRGNGETIFLLHGQPSWSYLYRHMIPQLVAAGYRVIAPDLIGFGKSDKPAAASSYSYQAQVDWMSEFVEKLGLDGAHAFRQDWGGMIGLRVMAQKPSWISRLIVANTALADVKGPAAFFLPKILKTLKFFAGKASLKALARKQSYGNWASYFHWAEAIEIGEIMQILTTRHLSEEEKAAYDAPFPENRYHVATRVMPQIVATQLPQARLAWDDLRKSATPVMTLFSDKDPFLAGQGVDKQFQSLPGAQGQPHLSIEHASHFLQEDKGNELVKKILVWSLPNQLAKQVELSV